MKYRVRNFVKEGNSMKLAQQVEVNAGSPMVAAMRVAKGGVIPWHTPRPEKCYYLGKAGGEYHVMLIEG
jgi:hypothetical protein